MLEYGEYPTETDVFLNNFSVTPPIVEPSTHPDGCFLKWDLLVLSDNTMGPVITDSVV